MACAHAFTLPATATATATAPKRVYVDTAVTVGGEGCRRFGGGGDGRAQVGQGTWQAHRVRKKRKVSARESRSGLVASIAKWRHCSFRPSGFASPPCPRSSKSPRCPDGTRLPAPIPLCSNTQPSLPSQKSLVSPVSRLPRLSIATSCQPHSDHRSSQPRPLRLLQRIALLRARLPDLIISNLLLGYISSLPRVVEPPHQTRSPPAMSTSAPEQTISAPAPITEGGAVAAPAPVGTPNAAPATAQSNVASDSLTCQWASCGERCNTAEQLYVSCT